MKTGNFYVRDQYGELVYVMEIVENICYTRLGVYHASKLFVDGKSLSESNINR